MKDDAVTFRKYIAEQSWAMSNWSKTFQTFTLHSSVFAIEKLRKNLYFQSFLTSSRPFGGYFQWKTPISRKYIAEKGIVTQNWPKTFPTLSFHSSIFVLEKQPKIINFERMEFYNYLSLVATFSERRTPTSEIYVVEQDILMPNWLKTFQTFRSHSSVFATEKLRKSLNFQRFFT